MNAAFSVRPSIAPASVGGFLRIGIGCRLRLVQSSDVEADRRCGGVLPNLMYTHPANNEESKLIELLEFLVEFRCRLHVPRRPDLVEEVTPVGCVLKESRDCIAF